MSETPITDPEELLRAFESWGPAAVILEANVNGQIDIYRDFHGTGPGSQVVALKRTFEAIKYRLRSSSDGRGWKLQFFDPQDVLDHFILKTLKELQDADEDGEVNTPGLYPRFLACPLNTNKEQPLLKNETHVGRRLTQFVERGFIRVIAGAERDLTLPPFHASVAVTNKGERAIRRGPEAFSEEQEHPVANKFNIGPVHAQQAIIGDHGQQTMNVNITLDQLLRAAEDAVDAADVPEEAKKEAKSAMQKLRENLPVASAGATVTQFLMNHAPDLARLFSL